MVLSLTQMLRRNVQQNADGIATICAGRIRCWRDTADRVARLAAGLRALGMRAGDRVGMLALNSERFLEYYFATWWGGGAINPINIRWAPAEIAYSLDDCDTQILLIDDAFVPLLAELRAKSKSVRTIVYVGDNTPPPGAASFEELIRTHQPIADAERCNDDLAGVFYTGGTTGFPKGVMLSHANLVTNAMISLLGAPFEQRDKMLLVVPMFHIAGISTVTRSMLRGCCEVILPVFNPLAVLETIARERITITVLVPTMLQMLVDHPQCARFDLSSIRFIGYGASPISEAVLLRVIVAFPQAEFAQAFGQTELSPCVSFLTAEYHTEAGRKRGKLRSAGQALMGCELRVIDANGMDVPPGTIGEFVARSPGVMLGYWNKPELTAAALRDGWLHTGDAGYMDAEGFVFVVDRIKDMIVSGGENVYSAEVENALMQHPAVATCAVIGVPSEKWGETVHAVVVTKPGQSANAEQIIAHCKTLIAGYKCPRSVEFREQLPLSGAGKILKFELRKPFWEGAGRSVA